MVIRVVVNKVWQIVGALMALAILSSCFGRIVTDDDVIGLWKPNKASEVLLKSAIECKLVFRKDGTVAMESMPESFIKAPNRPTNARVSGSGRWSLVKKDGKYRIALTLSEIDGVTLTYQSSALLVEFMAEHIEMYYYPEEEGGDRFVLVKE